MLKNLEVNQGQVESAGDVSVAGWSPQDGRVQKPGLGVPRASGRCNQHYRKGGGLCLHILGVRREAGARVKEECSEGWHLKWVWTKWSWGRERRKNHESRN